MTLGGVVYESELSLSLERAINHTSAYFVIYSNTATTITTGQASQTYETKRPQTRTTKTLPNLVPHSPKVDLGFADSLHREA